MVRKRLRFPIGAILMLVCATVWLIYDLVDLGSFQTNMYAPIALMYDLSLVAFCVLLIVRKRGLPIFIISIIEVVYHIWALAQEYDWWWIVRNAVFMLIWGIIALISLEDMKVIKLVNFKNVMRMVFIILPLIKAIEGFVSFSKGFDSVAGDVNELLSVLYFMKGDAWDFLMVSAFVVEMILIGLWLMESSGSNEDADEDELTDKEKREYYYINLGTHICLLIFTTAIWNAVWTYKMTNYTNTAKGMSRRDPVISMLMVAFVPFYSIYWNYRTAQRVDAIANEKGMRSELSTVCLLLAIFAAPVATVLIQNRVNGVVRSAEPDDLVVVRPADEAEGEIDDGFDSEPYEETETEADVKYIRRSDVDAETVSNENQSMDVMERYKALLDSGVITSEEYEAKKKQLLGI